MQRVSEERRGINDADTIRDLFQQHFVRDQAAARLLGYRLSRNGHDQIQARVRIAGAAIDRDTVSASLKAVLSALNGDADAKTAQAI